MRELHLFCLGYVTTVLDDAKAYANHAKKKGIDLEDVKLAVSMQMEQSFTSPPPREVIHIDYYVNSSCCILNEIMISVQILMEVARAKNTTPLPSVKPHCGIRLPPDCHCLAACNYRLKTIKKSLPKSIALGSGSASSPRMTGVLGGTRTVHRPNSPAVRLTSVNPATTPSTPRPVVKINAGPTSATTIPKIQIAIPPLPNQPAEKMEIDVQNRGVKRERVDEDYDVA